MSKAKKKPDLKTEADERTFWESHDASDYVDWSQAQPASFPNLKPTSTSISLRIPNYILFRLKERANALNIPCQTLMATVGNAERPIARMAARSVSPNHNKQMML